MKEKQHKSHSKYATSNSSTMAENFTRNTKSEYQKCQPLEIMTAYQFKSSNSKKKNRKRDISWPSHEVRVIWGDNQG